MIRIRQIIILFLVTAFPLFVNAQKAETTKEQFARVKRIFVEVQKDGPKEMPLKPVLEAKLAKNRFSIAHTIEDADAILSGEAWFVMNMDGGLPIRALYSFRLVSKNKTVFWKGTIKFDSKVSHDNQTADRDEGAEKIVEKLFTDWKKARKQLGF